VGGSPRFLTLLIRGRSRINEGRHMIATNVHVAQVPVGTGYR
jgi:hypothetical protein